MDGARKKEVSRDLSSSDGKHGLARYFCVALVLAVCPSPGLADGSCSLKQPHGVG